MNEVLVTMMWNQIDTEVFIYIAAYTYLSEYTFKQEWEAVAIRMYQQGYRNHHHKI